MEIIKKNPFRVLGLPIEASEREITKKIQELSTFAEFGKSIAYPSDFDFISPLERTLEDIQEASRSIELPENKLYYSLFWFWSDNSVDELVFDLLADGDTEKALSLWNKSISENVTPRNFSNTRNLSLLYLLISLNGNNIDREMFMSSVDLAGKVLSHKNIDNYSEKIVGAVKVSDNNKIQRYYIDQILRISKSFFGQRGGAETKKLIKSFESFSSETYQYAIDKILVTRRQNIETSIRQAEEKREADNLQAYRGATELIDNSKDDLNFLGNALPPDDLNLQLLSDKVASEILKCSTAYYNSAIKITDDTTPHDKAKFLSQEAIKIALGGRLKEKLRDDIITIDSLKRDKERSLKRSKVDTNINIILNALENLPDTDSISKYEVGSLPQKAKLLIDRCEPQLSTIKNILGKDETYLKFCDLVVNNALGLCVHYANEVGKYKEIVDVLRKLLSMDMSSELNTRLRDNKNTIDNNYKLEQEQDQFVPIVNNIAKRIKTLPPLNNLSFNQIKTLPSVIEEFYNQSSQDLNSLKNNVGSSHEVFTDWSNTVAQICVSMTITYVNNTSDYLKSKELLALLTPMIPVLEHDLVTRIRENERVVSQNLLVKIAEDENNSSSGGCYIATMVYGDYDAPEVLLLRKYRDNVLAKKTMGKAFIKIYYYLSPKFVNHFSSNDFVQKCTHKILEKIITRIK